MIVLQILLYILLGVLALPLVVLLLIFLLSFLSIKVRAEYREEKFDLAVWAGPFRLPISLDQNPEEPADKPAESAPAVAKKPKQKKEKKKVSLEEWKNRFAFVKTLIGAGGKALKILFSHLYIRELSLEAAVGGDNAADTAVLYGKYHAAAGALFGVLFRFRHLGRLFVSITPDFDSKESRYQGSVTVQIRILHLLHMGLSLVWALLGHLIKNKTKAAAPQPEPQPSEKKGGQKTMSHQLEGLMNTAMQKIKEMVDVNTIIGEPIRVSDTITIIPVSKVSFGFASGGSDLPSKQEKELFGGGSGAGVTIDPLAFLVINGDNVQLMQYNVPTSTPDRAVSLVPDILDKVSGLVSMLKKDKKEAPAELTEEK